MVREARKPPYPATNQGRLSLTFGVTLTVHASNPSGTDRGRVEFQPQDPWQPYALFDDDGTRLTDYDGFLRAMAPFSESSTWLLMTAAMLLRWQQDCWLHDRAPEQRDRNGLADLLDHLSDHLKPYCVAALRSNLTGFQRHRRREMAAADVVLPASRGKARPSNVGGYRLAPINPDVLSRYVDIARCAATDAAPPA